MRILLATALVAASVAAVAHDNTPGYWGDGTDAKIWHNSYGECWQTGTMTKDQAIPACDPNAKPAAPAPKAAAAPAKAAPASSAADDAAAKAKAAADAAAAAAAAAAAKAAEEAAAARDDDGDGVPNGKDKCPNTPKGAKVDQDGCPIKLKEKVTISINVKFPTGSSKIDAAGDSEVKKLADFMTQYPNTSVEVGGHTDNVGNAATNTKLSQARADAVRKDLIEKFGIDGKRVTAKGYGPSKPIADNKTKAGRDANRRVEGVVSETVEKIEQR